MSATTLHIHYRGQKIRTMKDDKQPVSVFLDAFISDDLKTLGFPVLDDCICKGLSGLAVCTWRTERDLDLKARISIAFDAIDADFLPELSISMVGLKAEGRCQYITAPGVKGPSMATQKLTAATTRSVHPASTGRIQSAPRTYALSRMAPLPIGPPTSAAFSRKAHFDDTSQRFDSPRNPLANAHSGLATHTTRMEGASPQPVAEAGPSTRIKVEEKEKSDGMALRAPTPPKQSYAATTHGTERTSPQTPMSRASSSPRAHPSILSTWSAASSMSSVMPGDSVGNLTREVWDVRRELSALVAREDRLVRDLERLGARPVPEPSMAPRPAEVRKTMDDEASGLRARLEAESEARRAAESAVQQERRRREAAEWAVADVRRECSGPFVVPALMDAFVEISRLSGDALVAADYGAGP
ncbi:uncharacterized protein B0H18DRAFT_1030616 [Fomitopsis serialis]|uniref:uncharacterized protein n=1 Tax=Fomitopsis serialis TaxID=139415 RepID=UPI0020089831|nr:uncharacterized protein B0H18DRAFT_1030616 [Neoantrodia serialis]KAH9918597.1 hypothetical protein B0H18DRAFT_1030616 [Neoantrodia serialis]